MAADEGDVVSDDDTERTSPMTQQELPPEMKQALDHLANLNRDPDTTDAEIAAALDDLQRIADEKDPELGTEMRNFRVQRRLMEQAKHN